MLHVSIFSCKCGGFRMTRRRGLLARGAALLAASAITACSSGASNSAGTAASSSGSGAASGTPAAGHQGGTFTILANSAFGQADPAQNYTLEEWQLLIDTPDGLTSFAKVGGVAGTKIVPDLATSVRTAATGGKTDVFNIRKGS